jgi:agmatinase
MQWQRELEALLRPAGGGVFVVSTGKKGQERIQKRLYGVGTAAEAHDRFLEQLEQIPRARGVILGIPSDVGAGFVRGANMGPQVIRAALLDAMPDFKERADAAGLIDIGDVFVVPQLLHDDMLSEPQKEATRRALYPTLAEADRASLPVSPLSIAERVLDLVLAQNPHVAPFAIGGDHSTTWPIVAALARARKDRWAIVQPDAHTNLLEHRLGITYCFATWSYHANELLGRDGRMVQVGIRASGRDQQDWESTLGVRQFWAEQCRRQPTETIDAIIAHLRQVGAESVYFSNDIDGTDEQYADATGTPEPWGLEPDWLVRLIRRLGSEIGLVGGDIMEVAPPLRQIPRGAHKTTNLAVRYLRETIAATLKTTF